MRLNAEHKKGRYSNVLMSKGELGTEENYISQDLRINYKAVNTEAHMLNQTK